MSRRAFQLASELAALLAAERPDLAPIAAKLAKKVNPCRHGPDFSAVIWHDRRFTFTGAQAAVVRVLWKAWESGTPEVRQETIQEQAAIETRVAVLFTGSPAWGEMVGPGEQKGTFRLLEIRSDTPNR